MNKRDIVIFSGIFAIIALAALSVGAVALMLAAHRRMKLYYAALAALSIQFPGNISKIQKQLLHQPCFNGTFSGYRFSVKYLTDHGNVWRLKISCNFRSTSKMKIFMYSRNPGTVLFAKRITIGDHDFDNYFIYSNMPTEAINYFADDLKRNNIEQLINSGWEPPTISGKQIYTYAATRWPEPELDPAFVEATLRNLIALKIERI